MVASLIVSLLLQAATPQPGAPPDPTRGIREDHQTFDANRDGRIDRAEWLRWQWTRAYAKDDLDGDGSLSRDEYVLRNCGEPARVGAHFFDGCRRSSLQVFARESERGRVTARSTARSSTRFFNYNDMNHDGFVTVEEMIARARQP